VATREITYEVDGLTMVGRLAVPDDAALGASGTRPAVLIAPEANGLDDHQAARADLLAGLGYVALALDPHGGGRVLVERAAVDARVAALAADPGAARRLVTAALDVLVAQPHVDPARVAAIGYCLGGMLVLELARTGADLKAVVGFHPGLTTPHPEDSARIRGTVLVCVGAEDPYVTAEHRAAFEREMRAAGVDWRMIVYGGAAHSFTHVRAHQAGRPGLAYDRAADEHSWRAMLDLFAEVFAAV
jgi:dienelactone hydrolase